MKAVQPFAMLVALSFAAVTAAPAEAQGARGPKAKAPVTAGSPKTTAGAPKATGAAKATAPTTDRVSVGAGKKAEKTLASGKSDKGAAAAKKSSSTTDTTDAGSATGTTGGDTTAAVEPNEIATRISRNAEQKARLEAMLPAGMTLEEASAGFRNRGQFIAAVNASKNQQVSFDLLKEAMTTDGMSLGQAVKYVKSLPPAADAGTGETGAATGPGTGTDPGTGTNTTGGAATGGTGTGDAGTGTTTGGTTTGA